MAALVSSSERSCTINLEAKGNDESSILGESVKVTDKELEAFGRVGSVRSAGVYDGEPDKKGKTEKQVNVLLDGDTELTVFRADQVTAL